MVSDCHLRRQHYSRSLASGVARRNLDFLHWHQRLNWSLSVRTTPLRRRPTDSRYTRALASRVSKRAPQTHWVRHQGLSAIKECDRSTPSIFRFQSVFVPLDSSSRGRERRLALTWRSRNRQESGHAPARVGDSESRQLRRGCLL